MGDRKMTLYLRDEHNNTLFSVDVWNKTEDGRAYTELSAGVMVEPFSKNLLQREKEQEEFIKDFDELSELRGWLWETYYMRGNNDGSDLDDIISALKKILQSVSERYDLHLVID